MAEMTNYLETNMLDYYFNQTAFARPAAIAISWHTSSPGDGGSVANEVDLVGTGVGNRVTLTFNDSTARTISNTNTGDIASAAQAATITHFGLHRTDASLEMLCYAALDANMVLAGGEPIRLNPGAVTVDFTSAAVMSDYVVNNWLTHVFGSSASPQPANWFCSLHTGDPGTTGSNNEFVGGGYARAAVNWNAAEADDPWARVRNSAQVDFTNLQQTPISWWGIWDSTSGGNFLARRDQPDNTVVAGSNAAAGAQSLVLRVG